MINQSAEGRGRRALYNSRDRGEYSNRGRGLRQPGGSGEHRAQFGQQESPLGQAVLSDSPPPGLSEPGKTLQGVVVALLDSYGFIRQAGAPSCPKHLAAFLPASVHSNPIATSCLVGSQRVSHRYSFMAARCKMPASHQMNSLTCGSCFSWVMKSPLGSSILHIRTKR